MFISQYHNMPHYIRNLLIVLLVLMNAGCDQISKKAAREHISYYETIEIIGKHLVLLKTENSGAFLSAGDDMGKHIKFVILSFIPLLALIYGLYYLMTTRHLPSALIVGMAFVIGGGFGNLYDRIYYGSVTDFIHIDFYGLKTGIFNFADISIMIGMIFILVNLYKKRNQTHLTNI